jgi:hypothetical protein
MRCLAFTPLQRATISGLVNMGSPATSVSTLSDVSAEFAHAGGRGGLFELAPQHFHHQIPGVAGTGTEFGPPGVPYGDFATPSQEFTMGRAPVSVPARVQRHEQAKRVSVQIAQYNALARELQCDPGLVEAVAARLAASSMT